MKAVELLMPIAMTDLEEAYRRLCDFGTYPRHTTAVRCVRVERDAKRGDISHWDVNFRSGVLCWSEADAFRADERTIDFNSFAGDFRHFSGRWEVRASDHGPAVAFEATFDMGIPSLEHVLEPLAEKALIENVQRIVSGLYPDFEARTATG